MLTLADTQLTHTCQSSSRREFLRVGTLGLGGMSLAQLLSTISHAKGEGRHGFVKDKAVVMLNLQGGPTHIETFDPKMAAPSEYRAMFGEVATTLPGVTFGSHFPLLAKQAHRMAVVRSFAHGNSSHAAAAALVAAGGNTSKACMASIYPRIAGSTHPDSGLPRSILVTPKTMGKAYTKLNDVASRITGTGNLPPAYKAFDPSSGGKILSDMQLNLPAGRFEGRKGLLRNVDDLRFQADSSRLLASQDEFHQQAYEVILGGISQAFDISDEDPRTLAAYDTGHIQIPRGLAKKKKNGKAIPGFSPVALGRQMLLARRLCEAGCGFVTVTSTGWDMHGNAFGIDDGMPVLGPAVDKAASAFIEDIHQRGLADKILLVITGEFGRTPRINSKGGRDHWGNLCTLALAGGGLPMGQVVGASDKTASRPAEDPVTNDMLLGTVMHTLFDIGQVRLLSSLPKDVQDAVVNSRPIPQLS